MPRSRKYHSVGGGSTSTESSLEGDGSIGASTEMTTATQTKDPSGFSFMGLVFFGSDSEDDEEVNQTSSTSKSKQKVMDLAKLRRKAASSRYQLHESDDNSVATAETSETALFRYLFEQEQKALPVSDPEKIIQESGGRWKQSSSKGGRWMKKPGKQKNKVRACKGNSAFNQPRSLIPQVLPKKTVAHPRTKSDTNVARGAVFSKSNQDENFHSKEKGPIQRIMPFQEEGQLETELVPGGSIGEEILYDEEKPTKTCKLWPSSKHRKAKGASTYDDDDADSFLQFRDDDDDDRQASESVSNSGDKRDVMERMDSFEDDIQRSKPKSCLFLLPKRGGRVDEDAIGKEDSFTDLVEEHQNKRNFFPSWPSFNAETQESVAGKTESSTENSREQPEEAFQFQQEEALQFQPQKVLQYDRKSLAYSLKDQKIKNCWPAKSQQRRLGDKMLGTPKAYTRVSSPTENVSGPSRRIDTIDERKRFFPALIQHAPEDEQHAAVTAADIDIINIIEKREAECRRRKWRQLGGFGTDRPSYQDEDDDEDEDDYYESFESRDDESLESRDQEWPVAGSSVKESTKFMPASMYPLLDDDSSADDPSVDNAESFDSGWFTLESLVA